MRPQWFKKVLVATAIGSLCFSSAAMAEKTLKMAYALSKDSHYGAGAKAFEESIGKSTNGDIKIEQFANSALGGEREVIEGLQIGTVDAAILSTGATLNFVPQTGVFDIPFLFRDLDHARTVLDGKIGNNMLAEFPKRGLVALAWGEQGFRHLTNSKHAVKTPADLKGLKIRTTENPIHITAFKELGMLPTPMAWPEVQTALQQGTIDGQENPLSVIVSAKLSSQQKHLSLTGHVYAPAVIVISPMVYDSMTDEEKAKLKEAALAAAQGMRDFVDNVEASGLETLANEGMEITQDIDRAEFAKIVHKVYPEFHKKFSKELIESIQNTK
ncbi:MAG: TRAP transporter substrate-binding protein DctP [Alcaligenaceae bacterium]|nr:TRAP transporter substrate-binding protein DctP [Alcaligenaceae bacterium]